jgi:recombinational DNA repair protein (RecF pathway)
VHYKLVSGLTNLNLDASGYYLYLGETILELMGINHQSDTIYEHYLKRLTTVKKVDCVNKERGLNNLAAEIYEDLVKVQYRHA